MADRIYRWAILCQSCHGSLREYRIRDFKTGPMRAYLARKWQEKSREFESPSIHRGVSHGNQKCGKDLYKVGFGANFGGSVRLCHLSMALMSISLSLEWDQSRKRTNAKRLQTCKIKINARLSRECIWICKRARFPGLRCNNPRSFVAWIFFEKYPDIFWVDLQTRNSGVWKEPKKNDIISSYLCLIWLGVADNLHLPRCQNGKVIGKAIPKVH